MKKHKLRRPWEDVIADDFETLRKSGLDHAAFGEITAALGINSALDHEVRTLKQQVQKLYGEGKLAEAIPLAWPGARTICEERTEFAGALGSLAVVYNAQSQYREAEALYKRALAITEKALGPDHPDVGALLNNIAGLYRAQGRFSEAEPLYQRALAITEKGLGPDHPTGIKDLWSDARTRTQCGHRGSARGAGIAEDSSCLMCDI